MGAEKDRIRKIEFADSQCPLCMGSGVVGSLGMNLREVRESLGFSRDVIADNALVSAETIRNIEISKARPRLSTLVQIRKSLRKLGATEEQVNKIR